MNNYQPSNNALPAISEFVRFIDISTSIIYRLGNQRSKNEIRKPNRHCLLNSLPTCQPLIFPTTRPLASYGSHTDALSLAWAQRGRDLASICPPVPSLVSDQSRCTCRISHAGFRLHRPIFIAAIQRAHGQAAALGGEVISIVQRAGVCIVSSYSCKHHLYVCSARSEDSPGVGLYEQSNAACLDLIVGCYTCDGRFRLQDCFEL